MSDSLFIDDFRNSFKGGTRQNRFSVTGNIGAAVKRA